MIESIISLGYLIAVVLFIVGMRMMRHPDSARQGNGIALAGMILAIVASMFTPGLGNILIILVAMAVGTVGGLYFSKTVKMTAMPELVSFFNGMGGAAAALIGLVEYGSLSANSSGQGIVLMVRLILGSVSFTGSLIAMGKLQGKIKDIRINKLFAFFVFFVAIGLAAYILYAGVPNSPLIYGVLVISLVYGLLFV